MSVALALTDSVGRGEAARLGEDVARQLLDGGAAEVLRPGASAEAILVNEPHVSAP